MKKLFLFFCFMLPSFVYAVSPPFFCKYGKVDASFPEPVECQSPDIALRNLYISQGLCKSSQGKSNASMDGYLKVEASKYLLLGSDIRVKADGDWLGNGNGGDEPISFYDSLLGHRGNKDTNTEGNAYLTYNLSGGYSSSGQVWAINNAYYNACSKQDVFFQNKPHISASPSPFHATFSPGKVSVYYELDWNSKAVRENIPAKIAVYIRWAGGNIITRKDVTDQRGTIDIPVSGYVISKGKVYFEAEINDGTYVSNRVSLGVYARACPTGSTWTFQTGPGVSAPRGDCGYDANGNRCPVSAFPTSQNSYPLIRYTCL